MFVLETQEEQRFAEEMRAKAQMQQALGGGEVTWGQQVDAQVDAIDEMDFDWREHRCAQPRISLVFLSYASRFGLRETVPLLAEGGRRW